MTIKYCFIFIEIMGIISPQQRSGFVRRMETNSDKKSTSSKSTDAFARDKSKKKQKEMIVDLIQFSDGDTSSQQEPSSRLESLSYSKLGDLNSMSQSSCLVSDSMSPSFDMKSVFNNIKSPFSETKLVKFSILKQNSVMEGDSSMTFKSVEHNRNIVTKLLSNKAVVCQENLQQNVSMFNESVLDDDMCTEKM